MPFEFSLQLKPYNPEKICIIISDKWNPNLFPISFQLASMHNCQHYLWLVAMNDCGHYFPKGGMRRHVSLLGLVWTFFTVQYDELGQQWKMIYLLGFTRPFNLYHYVKIRHKTPESNINIFMPILLVWSWSMLMRLLSEYNTLLYISLGNWNAWLTKLLYQWRPLAIIATIKLCLPILFLFYNPPPLRDALHNNFPRFSGFYFSGHLPPQKLNKSQKKRAKITGVQNTSRGSTESGVARYD